MNISIIEADKKDLPEILKLQKLAFTREVEEYKDFNIEPMTQTLGILEEEFETYIFLKAITDSGEIIGSTRGYIQDGTSYVFKVIVHPDYQGQGIGTNLIHRLEELNQASRYEINASIRCPQNIRLYENLGYRRFKEIKTENNGFIYLEK